MIRRRALIAGLPFLLAPKRLYAIGSPSASDVAMLDDKLVRSGWDSNAFNHEPLNADTGPLFRSDPRLVNGQTTFIGLFFGQSMMSNNCDGVYTPVNTTSCQMLSLLDGGVYQGRDPMIGCGGRIVNTGSVVLRLGDKLITDAVCGRHIALNAAIGSSFIADYAPGGPLNSVVTVAKRRLDQHGYTPTYICLNIGVKDTNNSVSAASWVASFNALLAQMRTYWAATIPILVALETCNGLAWTLSLPAAVQVRNAQAAVLSSRDNVKAGADEDSILFGYRQADGIHWAVSGASGDGANQSAILNKTAIRTALGV